jgi:hypothetical protein
VASEPEQIRASGQTQSTEVAEEAAAALTEPVEDAVLPEERERIFQTPGFSRMRIDWRGDDAAMMQRIKSTVEGAILNHFADAYAVMNDLYDVVREPVVNEATGEVAVDQFGFVQHQRSPTGAFIEDWSRLTTRQREDFLYRITTALFAWEQRAADLWGEAMFAKAIWTERFATEYDRPQGRATVEARTALANMGSAEDRYFAIFTSMLSRKADAVVRTMTLIAQRIKDTLGQ